MKAGNPGLIITPADYARWRSSRLGLLTESIEQRAVLRLCGDLSGRRVLDLGCGDGGYTLLAAKRGASAVVGLDISPEMLDVARSHADAGGTQVRWCRASVDALPFARNVFDIIIAVTALCFRGDPGTALKEAARVLRPGGSFVIGELGRYSAWAVLRRVRGWLGSRTWSGTRFRTLRELRLAVEAAGLRFDGAVGCVYYPPVTLLGKALGPFDSVLSPLGQFGAAFIAVKATKSQ